MLPPALSNPIVSPAWIGRTVAKGLETGTGGRLGAARADAGVAGPPGGPQDAQPERAAFGVEHPPADDRAGDRRSDERPSPYRCNDVGYLLREGRRHEAAIERLREEIECAVRKIRRRVARTDELRKPSAGYGRPPYGSRLRNRMVLIGVHQPERRIESLTLGGAPP
jgi:hypothetical protein